MGPSRAARESPAAPTRTEGWFAEWLRSVALGASVMLAVASVVVLITRPSLAIAAIPAAAVWAMAAIALAYREHAGGLAVAMCGTVFALVAAAASALAFGDGADSRGWMFAAGFVLAATAGTAGAGWWLALRPEPAVTVLGPAGRWPRISEVACYVTAAAWVLFGVLSIYAIVVLGLIGLAWAVAGVAVGRGRRVPTVLVAVGGAVFSAMWLLALSRGTDPDRNVPAWVWVASGVWCAASATASIAAVVGLFKAAGKR